MGDIRWRAAVNCVCCDEAVSASLHVMNIIYSPMMLVCRVLQAQMHPGRFARASADWGDAPAWVPRWMGMDPKCSHPSLGQA